MEGPDEGPGETHFSVEVVAGLVDQEPEGPDLKEVFLTKRTKEGFRVHVPHCSTRAGNTRKRNRLHCACLHHQWFISMLFCEFLSAAWTSWVATADLNVLASRHTAPGAT